MVMGDEVVGEKSRSIGIVWGGIIYCGCLKL